MTRYFTVNIFFHQNCSIFQGLLYQAIIPLLYVVVVASYRIERGKTIRSSKEIGNFTGVVSDDLCFLTKDSGTSASCIQWIAVFSEFQIGAILFALSPLFTLIFTPPYRNALKRLVRLFSRSCSKELQDSSFEIWKNRILDYFVQRKRHKDRA